MAVSYPLGLRTIISASKKRRQPASFSMSEPRRGYAYVQKIGTDVPVLWDVSFAFTQAEAIIFRLWFKRLIDSGVDEFTMPIRTEFGVVTHTCRFLPDGLLDTTESGKVFTYQASIMARAEVIPDGYEDAAELIVTLEDWEDWAAILDLAVGQEMPV